MARTQLAIYDFGRKLTLWHARTFRPILTHGDLEPILEKLGFIPLSISPAPPDCAVVWRDYAFRAISTVSANVPRVRLPFPEIDGVHYFTFRDFLNALTYYLGAEEVYNLFDIRSLPLDRTRDQGRSFRVMRDCGIDEDWRYYVYREGTLTPPTLPVCSFNSAGNASIIDNNICYMRLNVALKGKYKEMDLGSINLDPQTNLVPR